MKRTHQSTIYHKTLLVILAIAIMPSLFGSYFILRGSQDVFDEDLRNRLLTQSDRFCDRASESLDLLHQETVALFQDRMLTQTINKLEKTLREKPLNQQLTKQQQQYSSAASKRIQFLFKQLPILSKHPATIFHRSHNKALIETHEGTQEKLLKQFSQFSLLTSSENKWNIYDRLDQNTGKPIVFILYGIDGPNLRQSRLHYFVRIDLVELLPYFGSGQIVESIGLTLLSKSGHTLFKSGQYNLPQNDFNQYQFFQTGLLQGEMRTKDFSEQAEKVIAWKALPWLRSIQREKPLDSDWILCVVSDTTETQFLLGWLHLRVGLTTGGLILVIFIMSALLARKLVRPVIEMTHAAESIAQGDFRSRVPIRTNDELGQLGHSFNGMAAKLEKSYADLENSLQDQRLFNDQLTMLQEIANAVNTQLSLDHTLDTAMQELDKLIDCDLASISILEADRKTLKVLATYPERNEEVFKPGYIIPLQNSNRGWVIRNQKPLIKNISQTDNNAIEDEGLRRINLQTLIVLPLISSSGIIGTFGIGSKQANTYGERELEIMRRMSNSLALALDHARLFDEVREFASELENKVAERTEQLERAQTKIIQTEKLAATGRLAGTLAHEINNPLGIIKNYLKIVIDQVKAAGGGRRKSDPGMDHLLIMQEELDRIARIIKNLINFYKPGLGLKIPTNLQQDMDQILLLLEKDWEKRNIKIQRHYIQNMPTTEVEPDLLKQVFMNLLRNAEDAMENGGTLTIRFTTTSDPRTGQTGQIINIELSDTGIGIPQEAHERIFDPFFTTKLDGKGTGLGLSVTYSILNSIGGSIDVKSQPQQGTTFNLTIPVIKSENPTQPPSGQSMLLG